MGWNGKFNSDNHYLYYCGQEFLGRNGVSLIVNSKVHNLILGCNLNNNRMDLSTFPRKIIQYHSNPKFMRQTLILNKVQMNCSMITYKIF